MNYQQLQALLKDYRNRGHKLQVQLSAKKEILAAEYERLKTDASLINQSLDLTFIPSKYQQAIFDWVQYGRGDAVIQAVAGSGKTKTLVECSKLLRSSKAIFLAFNKHIASEIQGRVGKSVICKTIHSIGMGTLRSQIQNPMLDENKYFDIAKPYAEELAKEKMRKYQAELRRYLKSEDQEKPEEPPTAISIASIFKKLAHFCRVTLTDPKNFDALEIMANHFDCLNESSIELYMLHEPLISILKQGVLVAERQKIIDYDDMIWLPWKWDLQPSLQDYVMVDECQDLSPAQLNLVLKMRSKGGRMIFVGDPNQAIYGFAGASSDSIEQIISFTSATILPLSICYRCPESHIKLAQKIVPAIEPAPDAKVGTVEFVPLEKIGSVIREGDLIISRCTAPIVRLCINLIATKIPARVKGRDIGKSLTVIVKEIAKKPDFVFSRFGDFLKEYKDAKKGKLEQKRNCESQIQSLCDRIDGIQICYESFDALTVEQLCQEIEDLFSDGRSSVVLSTIHRAKGLEENRVFILEPEKLPLKWANQKDWQFTQEKNLEYVALTRAKDVLYFIADPGEAELEKIDQEKDTEEEEVH